MSAILVQEKIGFIASGTSLVVTLDALPTADNLIIVALCDSNDHATSITGGGVAAWGPRKIGNAFNMGTDVFAGISDGSSAAITINGPSGAIVANVSEWVDATATLKGTPDSGGGTGTTAATPTVTPSIDNCLLFAAVSLVSADPTSGPTNGFTSLTGVSSGAAHLLVAYKVQTALAATSTAYTRSPSGGYDACLASFEGSAPSVTKHDLMGMSGFFGI